jgi:16S rRNA pseudouridine516 synthase
MFSALGNRVISLHRDRIGALDLPEDLEPGAWRILDAEGRGKVLSSSTDSVPGVA